MWQSMFLYVVFGAFAVSTTAIPKSFTKQIYLDNESIQKFREYVQIDTSIENNIDIGVEFWKKQADELGLNFTVHRPACKPVTVLTWAGTDPQLPAIMLNSHMDVVTTEQDLWTYPPFSAHIDENGDIYGRGTQDDKDVAIQYIEAIRQLKTRKNTLLRTLHLTVMPDEESGGFNGMTEFIKTEEFKKMNVGFVLDEGITSADDTLYVTYRDKRPWQIKITVRGEGGHSAAMANNTAIEKLHKIINKIEEYREIQKQASRTQSYGEYDSVNINVIQGGLAPNIVPERMSLIVDVRWAVDRDVENMQKLVNSWILEGGNNTVVEYIRRVERSDATIVDDTNAYWAAMKAAIADMGLIVKPVVLPAASDMINIRNIGIPALGFSAKTHTNNRIHGINEYLNAATFLRGIEIYVNVLQKLGNLLAIH